MNIGICTGGGDCPGLNAVIRAVVKRAIGGYGGEVYGIYSSFNGLFESPRRYKKLGLADVTDILHRGGTILGTLNQGNPLKTAPDQGKAIMAETKKTMRELGMQGIIAIGGDGTQQMSRQFIDNGINIIGVPKTIDNDLSGTQQSIGFSTAVDVATEAVRRLTSTAESHHRIMILEVMGRDAGYIAMAAGIAGGAHVILIPEIPFLYEQVVKKIEERQQLGRLFSVIVVAEGAFEVGSDPVFKQLSSGLKVLGGIGSIVAKRLHELTHMETRVTVLGHVQRGGSPNAFDCILATAMGVHATDLAFQGKFNRLVGLEGTKIVDNPYPPLSGTNRPLDTAGTLVRTAEGIGISVGRPTSFSALRNSSS